MHYVHDLRDVHDSCDVCDARLTHEVHDLGSLQGRRAQHPPGRVPCPQRGAELRLVVRGLQSNMVCRVPPLPFNDLIMTILQLPWVGWCYF